MENSNLKTFIYFSELLGHPLLDSEGNVAGKLVDLKVKMGELFPKVMSIIATARKQKKRQSLDWADVETVNSKTFRLKPGSESKFRPVEVKAEEILLREEILDKQVVDTFGAKIERVNDIHFLITSDALRVVHVDFGIRGLLRRLGWLGAADSMTNWLFAYQLREKLISWKYVQPLASDASRKNLKLNVTSRKLHELHPSELADIIEELDQQSRSQVFKALDLQTQAQTLEEMESDLQVSLIESAPLERASDILEEMAPDEAKDLLADLSEEKKQTLMQTMEKPSREKLEDLLRFKEGTAGSIMTKDFIMVHEDQTVGDAIEEFRKTAHPLETVAYIFVSGPEGRLSGVITLRHLLLVDRNKPVGELMNRHLIKVEAEDNVEKVADVFEKYKFLMIPVVDAEARLTGVITFQDIIQERCRL